MFRYIRIFLQKITLDQLHNYNFIHLTIADTPCNSVKDSFCTSRPGRRCRTFSPGGVPPYMGYIGMCGPKGYGFSAVLVIDRVSILAILAILVINGVWFSHSSLL